MDNKYEMVNNDAIICNNIIDQRYESINIAIVAKIKLIIAVETKKKKFSLNVEINATNVMIKAIK